ncbi:hephaestin-like protein [Pomacea canaliculata]|uniref:hephaestin-like protein n=1 Tax=Pomacea canaliculata TaxID=400727 RepID=UPI000D7351F2|nr:hephaestin-like protein [Pomacea canaliculata]
MKRESSPKAFGGTTTILLGVLVLIQVTQVSAVVREYYVAAVEEIWNYAPSGKDNIPYISPSNEAYSQSSIADTFLEQGPQRIGSQYKKIMYREYTNGSFTVQKPREEWMGFLGPILAGEKGDTISVLFKNMGPRNFSMHPHGLQYKKNSEGAFYQDGTSIFDKADDTVPPGQQYKYEWLVTESSSPTDDDEDCLTWVYHSHVNTPRDANSGLVGILITCKPGTLDTLAQKYRKQYALFLTVTDENESWLIDENIKLFATNASAVDKEDPDFMESNKMHGINGRLYANLEGLTACVGDTILWHLVGFGSEVDIHTLRISGHSFLSDKHRIDSVSMNPVDFMTATMEVNSEGKWRINCNVDDHINAGMVALLDVAECPYVVSKRFSLADAHTFRNYYIGIDILPWNYAPSGRNLFDGTSLTQPGSPSEIYAKKDGGHIGLNYYKAVFREYNDTSFKHPKQRGPDEVHLGLLGPVIRTEVGDVVAVTLHNNADRSYSIHPHGAVLLKMYEGALYNDSDPNKKDDLVKPKQKVTTYWFIPENMGPGPADPPCITRLYTSSSLDVVRDSNAGLVGPILICRRGALGKDNKQIQIDREYFLMFSVWDENLSWYYNFNILVSGVSIAENAESEFQESNRMHGINGYIYGNLPGLDMCTGDRVSWHVLSTGNEADVHSVYFHGHDVTDFDTRRSAVPLLPGLTKTLYMHTTNPGEWALVCRTNSHYTAGSIALYNVSDHCGLTREYNMGPNDVFNRPRRVYYIQAEEEFWDYAPFGVDNITGTPFSNPDFDGYIFTRSDPPFLGKRYKKVRYHQYTDATFTTEILREDDEQFMGILGPVIKAEYLDIIEVHFRNNASRPYSIHAQGLFYNKSYEGLAYGSNPQITSTSRGVNPGETVTYVWSVPLDYAPATGDPNCIIQAYYSGVDPQRDTNSGLAGPLVICKPGILNSRGKRNDVSKSVPLLFSIFNENNSWYIEENIRLFGTAESASNPDFAESNLLHTINGYLYGNNPPITIPQYDLVDWQLMTLGSELDIHDVHFHGNEITVYESGTHHRDVTQLYPGIFRDVTMNATMPGKWLLHCHVHDHIKAGMETFYTVVKKRVTKPTTPFSFGNVDAN